MQGLISHLPGFQLIPEIDFSSAIDCEMQKAHKHKHFGGF
jgi:hypothetical protein